MKLNFSSFCCGQWLFVLARCLLLAAFSTARWLILRGLRWQFGLELFQHAHGSLTIALPMVILAGDVLSGRLEVGRVIDCR